MLRLIIFALKSLIYRCMYVLYANIWPFTYTYKGHLPKYHRTECAHLHVYSLSVFVISERGRSDQYFTLKYCRTEEKTIPKSLTFNLMVTSWRGTLLKRFREPLIRCTYGRRTQTEIAKYVGKLLECKFWLIDN